MCINNILNLYPSHFIPSSADQHINIQQSQSLNLHAKNKKKVQVTVIVFKPIFKQKDTEGPAIKNTATIIFFEKFQTLTESNLKKTSLSQSNFFFGFGQLSHLEMGLTMTPHCKE